MSSGNVKGSLDTALTSRRHSTKSPIFVLQKMGVKGAESLALPGRGGVREKELKGVKLRQGRLPLIYPFKAILHEGIDAPPQLVSGNGTAGGKPEIALPRSHEGSHPLFGIRNQVGGPLIHYPSGITIYKTDKQSLSAKSSDPLPIRYNPPRWEL